MKKRALLLHPADNCIVALCDIARGDTVYWDSGETLSAQAVSLGHKLACVAIQRGAKVIKYGAAIGSATRDIQAGEHIHTHNLHSDAIAIFHHHNAGYQPDQEAP